MGVAHTLLKRARLPAGRQVYQLRHNGGSAVLTETPILCAGDRTRTCKSLRILPPKGSVSASFTTPAVYLSYRFYEYCTRGPVCLTGWLA